MQITWGQATHTGVVRKQNEDAVFSLYVRGDGAAASRNFGIFIVADGMGGHEAGAKAAQIATQTISQVLLDSILKPILESRNYLPISEAIVSAMRAANKRILNEVGDGGGCTATTTVILDDEVFIGHAGDTVAISMTPDQSERLTRIHDFIHALIEGGHLTWEELGY